MDACERQDWVDWVAWKIDAIREGRNLVPIHELRAHATGMGLDRAGFDSILREMRADGLIRLRAISDYRKATKQQFADSIENPGETLFYVA